MTLASLSQNCMIQYSAQMHLKYTRFVHIYYW
jgi:hypothetical protein